MDSALRRALGWSALPPQRAWLPIRISRKGGWGESSPTSRSAAARHGNRFAASAEVGFNHSVDSLGISRACRRFVATALPMPYGIETPRTPAALNGPCRPTLKPTNGTTGFYPISVLSSRGSNGGLASLGLPGDSACDGLGLCRLLPATYPPRLYWAPQGDRQAHPGGCFVFGGVA